MRMPFTIVVVWAFALPVRGRLLTIFTALEPPPPAPPAPPAPPPQPGSVARHAAAATKIARVVIVALLAEGNPIVVARAAVDERKACYPITTAVPLAATMSIPWFTPRPSSSRSIPTTASAHGHV